MIVGIDEVGRGSWAGPLCVGAVALGEVIIPGLNDSKLVSKKMRPILSSHVLTLAKSVGIGWVSASNIDAFGLTKALNIAALQALAQIVVDYDEIILDGTQNFIGLNNVTVLKKADQLIPAVSAASIIAKVARDRYMGMVDNKFPGYGFSGNVGYGTLQHRQSLANFGPCDIHRMSFEPLAIYLPQVKFNSQTTVQVTSSGSIAENLAAEYLTNNGFSIIKRNWKTKWCEIDIIAKKANHIHFVEVKYRKNNSSGTGFDYITPKKLKQMKFAAQLWLTKNKVYQNTIFRLSAMQLSGENYKVEKFVDLD